VPDALGPLGERMLLRGVFLHGASVMRGMASHLVPGEARAQAAVPRIELGEDTIVCYYEATAEMLNSDGDTIVTISVTYALVYDLAAWHVPVNHYELQTYANISGRIQAQPYLREFIATTSARMGLPVFYLPLIQR
jgi:hypothetical protein